MKFPDIITHLGDGKTSLCQDLLAQFQILAETFRLGPFKGGDGAPYKELFPVFRGQGPFVHHL